MSGGNTNENSSLLVDCESSEEVPQKDIAEKEEEKNREERVLENYLKYSGFGLFHVFLLLITGLATAADAVEIFGVSFVVPIAADDLNLSTGDKGWLDASIFIGMRTKCYCEIMQSCSKLNKVKDSVLSVI